MNGTSKSLKNTDGRTRTGTVSLPVDFESTMSAIPSHRRIYYLFIITQAYLKFKDKISSIVAKGP